MDPDGLSINNAVLGLVPKETCRKYTLIPLDRIERTLMVAIADPGNIFALDDIKFMTGYDVVPVEASEASILAAIERLHGPPDPEDDGVETIDDGPIDAAPPAPVVSIVNRLLTDAIEQDASDVHLQPTETGLRVSFRIDGVMRDCAALPRKVVDPLTSRLKIMAKLDIAERRLPQDGRIVLKLPDGRKKTFRMATLPTLWGERLVLHLPDHKRRVPMAELGFSPEALDRLTRAVQLPSGLVVIAGPAGSGRSTTRYAIVDALNTGARSILTAEDAVELSLDGVGQVQLSPNIGMTPAAALRSFARHDPDVVMLCRIPDEETANIALELASNGVAVVSSLDADGAPAALLALAGLGCSPAVLASKVRCIFAQRLVRKLCERCKAEAPVSRDQLDSLRAAGIEVSPGSRLWEARGCPACRHTGYRGRLPIAEVLTCAGEVKAALMKGASAPELRTAAVADGMLTFAGQAAHAAISGQTTIDECLRLIADTQSP
jgi:type IV pilus assembly protein PilB